MWKEPFSEKLRIQAGRPDIDEFREALGVKGLGSGHLRFGSVAAVVVLFI